MTCISLYDFYATKFTLHHFVNLLKYLQLKYRSKNRNLKLIVVKNFIENS